MFIYAILNRFAFVSSFCVNGCSGTEFPEVGENVIVLLTELLFEYKHTYPVFGTEQHGPRKNNNKQKYQNKYPDKMIKTSSINQNYIYQS